jgi:hypothetical protein
MKAAPAAPSPQRHALAIVAQRVRPQCQRDQPAVGHLGDTTRVVA